MTKDRTKTPDEDPAYAITFDDYEEAISELAAPDKALTFHEAWGAAADRAGYDKRAWVRAQPTAENLKPRPLASWLRLMGPA